MTPTPKLFAEFVGTFVLVFGGTGSAVLAANFLDPSGANTGLGIGFVGVSLAFGLTVLTMAYAVGHISGGHFNPAITIGLATGKRFAWKDAVPYIVTQVIAAYRRVGDIVGHRHRATRSFRRLGRRRRLRGQRLRRPLARVLQPCSRPRHRGRADSDLPDRDHGHHRHAAPPRASRRSPSAWRSR